MARSDYFGDYVVETALNAALDYTNGGPYSQPAGRHGGYKYFDPRTEDPFSNYTIRERIFAQIIAEEPAWYAAMLAGAKGGNPYMSLSGSGFYATLTNNYSEPDSLGEFLMLAGAMAGFTFAAIAAAAGAGATLGPAAEVTAAEVAPIAEAASDAALGDALAAGWEGAVAETAAQNAALAAAGPSLPGLSGLIEQAGKVVGPELVGVARSALSALVASVLRPAVDQQDAAPVPMGQGGNPWPWLLGAGALVAVAAARG